MGYVMLGIEDELLRPYVPFPSLWPPQKPVVTWGEDMNIPQGLSRCERPPEPIAAQEICELRISQDPPYSGSTMEGANTPDADAGDRDEVGLQ